MSGTTISFSELTGAHSTPSTSSTPQHYDFLEWWRYHYGTEYDGVSPIIQTGNMTDEDYAIGKSLYSTYDANRQAKDKYDASVAETNQYYAGEIAAVNEKFNTQVGAINKTYDENAATLLKNYNTSSANAKSIYDQSIAALEENYGKSQESLDNSKKRSQQAASITYDKLKKYLPTQIKAQGLSGLGVSESSMIQAHNTYTSNMGDIESDYFDRKGELEKNYTTAKNSYGTNYQTIQGELDTAYNTNSTQLSTGRNEAIGKLDADKTDIISQLEQRQRDELAGHKSDYDAGIYNSARDANGNLLVDNVRAEFKEEREKAQLSSFNDAMENIANLGYTTQEEMDAYIEQFRGKVTESQFNDLSLRGQVVVRKNVENEQESNYNTAIDSIEKSTIMRPQEMEAYIEQNYYGRVSEEQYKNLLEKGSEIVQANIKAYNLDVYERVQKEKQELYETGTQNIASLGYTTEEEMEAYIKQNYFGRVSESQYNNLLARGMAVVQANVKNENDYASDNATATLERMLENEDFEKAAQYLEANKDLFGSNYKGYSEEINIGLQSQKEEAEAIEKEEQEQRILEGKEYLSSNGHQYQISESKKIDTGTIMQDEGMQQLLYFAGFSGPYDKNIPNGFTMRITKKVSGAAFEVYATYFNGEWYAAKKIN